MIDVYYFPSPNTWKVTIMLEECGLPYRIVPVNTLQGEQLSPQLRRISPNGRIPAIVDHATGAAPLSVFESGAILVYLAEKTRRLLPERGAQRAHTLEWLFWQVGGLGPMAGQTHYFRRGAPESFDAGTLERFVKETRRLYGVLDAQLASADFITGEYSIADIACWSWVWFHKLHLQDLAEFPNIGRWFAALGARPAVLAGRRVGLELVPEEQRGLLEQGDSNGGYARQRAS
jgi:GST-like protein